MIDINDYIENTTIRIDNELKEKIEPLVFMIYSLYSLKNDKILNNDEIETIYSISYDAIWKIIYKKYPVLKKFKCKFSYQENLVYILKKK